MESTSPNRIVDVCVIPPLPETLDGFGSPDGAFAKYNELYGSENQALLDAVRKDPAGFLIGLMDDAGIDVAILPAEDAETTMAMKTPNEKVSAFAAQAPDRFRAMAAVDPHKGMQAVRDLEFAVKELGMTSLCLEPWLHKIRSNDKRYYPIYAKAAELGIPVWIHTSLNFVPQLKMDFGRPVHLDEVAGHFPELSIIAGHGGWPWVGELMAVMWRHDNMHTDISAVRPKYLAKSGSGWEPLMCYGDSFLQDRVLFGTAWPARMFRQSVEELRALPLKESVKNKWLGGNACRLFNLTE